MSSSLSPTNQDSYCHEWCLQGSNEKLVGVEVYRIALPHMKEIDDVYCACLYSNGIYDIEVTDYSPNADYITEGAAVGAVHTASGDLNSICYRRNASSSPSTSTQASRSPISSPTRGIASSRPTRRRTSKTTKRSF